MPGESDRQRKMKLPQCLSTCVLLVLCAVWRSDGGNILVWYTEGSHWINMKPVLDTLVDRGHQVTVLVPSSSMFMNGSEASRFHYEPFNVSFSTEQMETLMADFLHFSMYEMDHMNLIQMYLRFVDLIRTELQYSLKTVDAILRSDIIMKKLKEAKYDLLFADPIYPGSELLAEVLDIPLVFTLRFSLVDNWERHCGQLPSPPSFVPGSMSKLTDKMNFFERALNFLFYVLNDVVTYLAYWKDIDEYYSAVKGELLIYKRQINCNSTHQGVQD